MSEVNENVNVPETKTVVVYDAQDIEQVLSILDNDTPVRGIETMRQVVNVFDVLKTKGFVQQAQTEFDPGMQPMEMTPAEMVDPNAPTFVGEGDVMYDGNDADIAEEVEEAAEVEHVDGEIVEE